MYAGQLFQQFGQNRRSFAAQRPLGRFCAYQQDRLHSLHQESICKFWVAGLDRTHLPGRRGSSISGLAKAVTSKLSSGKGGGGAGNSKTGFSRFDDGQHGVELGGNGHARGAAL